jgi:iron(III) transport system permease protein
VGGSLTRSLRIDGQQLALLSAGTLLAGASLLPLLALLGDAAASSENAIALLSGARPWVLIARSTWLAALVTVAALVLGIPLGALIALTDVRGARAAAALHAFPMFLPPFILALGWFHLFGRSGLFGSAETSRLLFSDIGVVGVLALAFAPVVTSLLAVALRGIDPSLEEAARTMAPPFRVATRILIPAAAPALALAAIVVFALAFSELGVPMFLRVDAFPAAVFARLGGIDYAPGEAFALVLPLLPLALLLLALERRYAGRRSFAVLGLRSRSRERLCVGRWRAIVSVVVWTLVLAPLLPIAALVWRAWVRGGFAQLSSWLGWAPLNSLISGAIAATLVCAVALVLGHAVARRVPGSLWLDAVAVLAFVTPAAVLGVGLIGVWNRSATQVVYGSVLILVVGFVARYAAVAVRAVAASVAQTQVHLEEAAAACGARYWRRLLRVVFPLHRRGVAFAWLLAFVFCLRDLETAALFYPPGGEPLTVRLFTLEANGPEAVLAALAVTQVAMTAVALGAAASVWRSAEA